MSTSPRRRGPGVRVLTEIMLESLRVLDSVLDLDLVLTELRLPVFHRALTSELSLLGTGESSVGMILESLFNERITEESLFGEIKSLFDEMSEVSRLGRGESLLGGSTNLLADLDRRLYIGEVEGRDTVEDREEEEVGEDGEGEVRELEASLYILSKSASIVWYEVFALVSIYWAAWTCEAADLTCSGSTVLVSALQPTKTSGAPVPRTRGHHSSTLFTRLAGSFSPKQRR